MKLQQQGRLLLYQPQKSPVQDFFLFEIVKNNCQIGNKLARSNYSFKKRQKELAREKRKSKKRQRKLHKATNIPD